MDEFFAGLEGQWATSLPLLQNLLLHLLLVLVLAQPLAWIYIRTHRGMSYSRSTVQSLILLSLIVTIVMLAIGDSLARAFGLFGALALIRFRTPIKDTRDTVFLFLAVAIGIAVGSGNLLLAVVGTSFALLVTLYLDVTGFGSRHQTDAVLRLRLPGDAEPQSALQRVLARHCRASTLMLAREGSGDGEMEFAYQLQLRDPASTPVLVADVRSIPGAGDVVMSMQTEHEEP
jgi:uncharacterized membrane protein YhiD involved in acid resistance